MYNLILQVAHISTALESNLMGALQVYPLLKEGQTASDLLGYRLCNQVEDHHYFLWFHNLYNQGESVSISYITTIFDGWFIARLRAANPIEEFDFKYHTELSDLLEDGSIGLLFELGKKSNE